MTGARSYSKGLAVIYGVLAVMGLIPGLNTMFGLVPIHSHDVWLHAVDCDRRSVFGWVAAARPETRSDKARLY